nr:immunoglobulin heavy chain junction region [Mus musculus]
CARSPHYYWYFDVW